MPKRKPAKQKPADQAKRTTDWDSDTVEIKRPSRKVPKKGGPQPDGSYILDDSMDSVSRYTTKLRPDVAETAYRTMLEATGQAPKTRPGEGAKNPTAVARGKAGGLKGGKARASTLSAEERQEAARLAARARWKKS